MNPSASSAEARADLMAGVIEHLACFIQSGRPRSAKLATLLLDRLAQEGACDAALGERCRQLIEVLEGRGDEPSGIPGAAPARPRQTPWLTWECLGEAA